MLMTEHNLWFYQRLMQGLRDAIAEGRLKSFADDFRARYQAAGGSKRRSRSAACGSLNLPHRPRLAAADERPRLIVRRT